jgi:hypothetical protein
MKKCPLTKYSEIRSQLLLLNRLIKDGTIKLINLINDDTNSIPLNLSMALWKY